MSKYSKINGIYEVGGSVRDSLLNIPHKDHDYAIECDSFETMKQYILNENYTICVEKPEYGHIKAIKAGKDKKVVDFTLCREDGYYSDNRRPDSIKVCDIYSDLGRRDFTINAIAINIETGEIIDPYNGESDLEIKLIKCVGKTEDRLFEDPLRFLRALRFSVTKDMKIDIAILEVGQDKYFIEKFATLPDERIQQELNKMFIHDTIKSLKIINELSDELLKCLFKKVILISTLKQLK